MFIKDVVHKLIEKKAQKSAMEKSENSEFFDEMLCLIRNGEAVAAVFSLDALFNGTNDAGTIDALLSHPLHDRLKRDLYIFRMHPRDGRSESPDWLDLAYGHVADCGGGRISKQIFNATAALPMAALLRRRRTLMQGILSHAWAEGARICALDSGRFREGDNLVGHDLSLITLVEREEIFAHDLMAKLGPAVVVECADPVQHLANTAEFGEKYDLIYSMGLAGIRTPAEASELLSLCRACLNENGVVLFANYEPSQSTRTWMHIADPGQEQTRSAAILSFDFAQEALACGFKIQSTSIGEGALVFYELSMAERNSMLHTRIKH